VTAIRLPYIQAFKDRHGKRRYYFRRPGFKRAALPGLPGSKAFMSAYQAAMESRTPPGLIGAERTKPGTMAALIIAYYASAEFSQLRDVTKSSYRGVMERMRTEHGHKLVGDLEPRHVREMMDARSGTPGAAGNYLKRLRTLMRFAVDRDWRDSDPTVRVRAPRVASEGFRAWTEADIAQFLERWGEGSRPRLAIALLLYTAQRRSDVVKLGRQNLKGDTIWLRQQKTGASLVIPIHPDLKRELDRVPQGQLTFLQTHYGKPFTSAGFGGWFSDRARDAGLPARSSPHGLRKAAARRLAEAGCSVHEIMAITGHKSLNQVAPYTQSADQAHLAAAAIAKTSRG
jgi:integrase